MKYFVKVILVLAASVAGLALGYLAGMAILPRLLMLMAHEPDTNVELYNHFQGSLPVVFASFAFGGLAGYGLGYWTEQTLNRRGLFGLFGWGGEEEPTASIRVKLEMTLQEEGAEPERYELFNARVGAAVLARFFHGEPGKALVLAHPQGHLTRLRLVRSRPGPYGERTSEVSPLLISLHEGRETLQSFESTERGRYWKPESKDYAVCRFQISHRGIEDALDGSLRFEGDPDVMSRVFLNDDFADV